MAPRRKKTPSGQGKGSEHVLKWHPYLNAYAERKWLVFATEEDVEAAIDLLWTDKLRSLPHGTPDGWSLLVPEEAVVFFKEARLTFEIRDAQSIDALGAEELS